MSEAQVFEMCEKLLQEDGPAALVMRQWLVPVEGKDAVVFPPTYPTETKSGYNIDYSGQEISVCQIDSVGSQANRMEPIFKKDPIDPEKNNRYWKLVPQIVIKVGGKELNLLDAGHRAGDAVVRFSPHCRDLWDAFTGWQQDGNAEPMARIAPTSIVFGAWDSRATQAKLPRIVRSVIRAYNVRELTRSALFEPPLHYVDEGVLSEELDKGEGEKNPLSQEGFRHSPARAHGGIKVLGEIRRDASLSLVAVRALGVKPKEGEKPEQTHTRQLKLRRYILGLALVAFTHRDFSQLDLREGCLLRPDPDCSTEWRVVPFEGKEQPLELKPEDALNYAEGAAKDFEVEVERATVEFNREQAERWLRLKKEDRDKRRRQGPVIDQELAK